MSRASMTIAHQIRFWSKPCRGRLARPVSLATRIRSSLRTGFGAVIGEELEIQRERERLLRSEPELRAAMLDALPRTLREMAELVAERAGRAPDDDAVLALAGAVIGPAAWLGTEGDDWIGRFLERVDTGMALLESGFRL